MMDNKKYLQVLDAVLGNKDNNRVKIDFAAGYYICSIMYKGGGYFHLCILECPSSPTAVNFVFDINVASPPIWADDITLLRKNSIKQLLRETRNG